jgi:hypothetical protein
LYLFFHEAGNINILQSSPDIDQLLWFVFPVFDNLPNTASVNENEAAGVSVFTVRGSLTVRGSQGDAGVPSALQFTITTFTAEFQIDVSSKFTILH